MLPSWPVVVGTTTTEAQLTVEGWVLPLPFRRPTPVLLTLYACSALGLVLAAVGVLVDGAIRLWWTGLVIVAASGVATQIVRWRSRGSQTGDDVD